jgi:hypothetical protein
VQVFVVTFRREMMMIDAFERAAMTIDTVRRVFPLVYVAQLSILRVKTVSLVKTFWKQEHESATYLFPTDCLKMR